VGRIQSFVLLFSLLLRYENHTRGCVCMVCCCDIFSAASCLSLPSSTSDKLTSMYPVEGRGESRTHTVASVRCSFTRATSPVAHASSVRPRERLLFFPPLEPYCGQFSNKNTLLRVSRVRRRLRRRGGEVGRNKSFVLFVSLLLCFENRTRGCVCIVRCCDAWRDVFSVPSLFYFIQADLDAPSGRAVRTALAG